MSRTFLINAVSLQKGGGLQVAVSLLEALKPFTAFRFVVSLSPQLAPLIPSNFGPHFTFRAFERNPSSSLLAWRRSIREFRHIEEQHHPSAVLTIFGPAYWTPRAPHLMGFAIPHYLFPRSRFMQQEALISHKARLRYAVTRGFLLHRLKREATEWWVETEEARAALAKAIRVAPHRVHVVPNAVGKPFLSYLEKGPGPPPVHGAFCALVMGAYYTHKNLDIIRPLLRLLHDVPIEFHVTLREEDFRSLFGDLSSSTKLRNLGPLAPQDAPAAYENAHMVFAPSKLEVFSAVYLEAMAMRRPVIASDLPFARQVCGNAAHYFDPWDPQDAARAIKDVIHNPPLYELLIRSGQARLREFPGTEWRAARLMELLNDLCALRR